MEKYYVWIFFYTSIIAVVHILIKLGINKLGTIDTSNLFALALRVATNPYILIGVTLLISSYSIWFFILTKAKLSLALPLTAVGYILVAILSYFILGERLNIYNYIGIAFIAGGVVFLSLK